MHMMKVCVALVSALLLTASSLAAPAVSDIKVATIPPWGLAIDCTVSGATEDDADKSIAVQATGIGDETYTAQNLSGGTICVNGAHRIYWNLAKDGITADAQNVTVTVGFPSTDSPTYCVIDLSGGANAATYPVTYCDTEPDGGFTATEYKTTKLVLKRVEAGSFIMGKDQTKESCRVTLTKPFYMALFETTQKQWELVTGTNPSCFSGEALPVETVSYDMIRGSTEGAKWPASNAVDEDSFFGKLRTRTGIAFDLPTEAQWEYVCRAGTTTAYSYGSKANSDYGWGDENAKGTTHEVGTKKPNPWGFYDLYGNVFEWCLDWWSKSLSYGKDPTGPASDSEKRRVLRSSPYEVSLQNYNSYTRLYGVSSDANKKRGFRVVASGVGQFGSGSAKGVSVQSVADGSKVNGAMTIGCAPCGTANAVVTLNDGTIVSRSAAAEIFIWQPQTTGTHVLSHAVGSDTLTATYSVESVNVTPTVAADDKVCVTGDAENGFVVKPGEANEAVVVTIPDGTDAAKVTVKVGPDVRTVVPNGAAVHVVRDGADITDFLYIPDAVDGIVNLSEAEVKAEYAGESLDVTKGAIIDLATTESPTITTAPTREGLVYRLMEGTTLDELAADADGDVTIGDGTAWTPNLTVNGGTSGFYSIRVSIRMEK